MKRIDADKVALWVALTILSVLACTIIFAYWLILRPDPLLSAAEKCDVAKVKRLLDDGASVETMDSWSGTPMMYAAGNGCTAVVKLLLDKGVNVNTPQRMARTPLLWAAKHGHTETVKLLIERGANLTSRDQEGKTAMELARDGVHAETIAVLRAAAGCPRPVSRGIED